MSKNINKLILISIIMSVFIGVTGYSLGMSLGKNSIVKQPLPIDNNMAKNDEKKDTDKVEDKNTSGKSSSSDTGRTSKSDNKNSKNKNSSSGSSSGRSSRGGSSSSASSANTSIPSKLKDGVYYGSAKGYGGEIKAKVTVSNGKISDIKIENHSETPEYYDRCSGIIPNIISSQSTNVDGVSGATFTSNGIKSAVANALKNAGASTGSASGGGSGAGDEQSAEKPNKSADKEEIKKLKKQIEELQNSNDVSGKLKDGKYEGTGTGFKSTIKVEVEVKGGKIKSIKVIENGDDHDYFEKAKTLMQSIISKQTTKVDSVSGATFSSNGIKSAVRSALKKAGSASEGDNSEELNKQLSKIREENSNLSGLLKSLNNKIEELQNSNDTTGKLKDGKYEGSGVGFKSTIKVEVEIKGGKIESIKVIENGDDHDYFEKAKALIQSIISNQSTKVDSISGATFSSNGIKSAVRAALKKASSTSEGDNSEELNQELSKMREENKKLNELIKTLNNKIEKLERESQNASPKAYKDGNYTGVNTYVLDVDGTERSLSVDVQISDGKIKNISVISIKPIKNGDAIFIDKAKEGTIPNIIEKNTTSVDAVSGATYTSNGIKDAVNDALKKAVNPSDNTDSKDLINKLKQAIEDKEKAEKEKKTLETENTSLKEQNTSLMSKIEELQKKIKEITSSIPSTTKAIHENIMSTLNGIMGTEKVKTN
ncbi:FMN-binding domain protein [Peptostreptococcus anaerobius 653-L]|uniref:FMN-binding domain protein n=1 Tax=Peptostreptococcus anaerobius 653-L TaxID=596329 RepID=D3MTJ5_9FIRM|nr:FMN-binding protein [Peptostreptococcus anaerobius]EFD04549.1 FMN-binding domain protein [Peptostreptococcus anaerobius 653-L]